MKKTFSIIRFAILSLAGLLLSARVGAQYMPVVYDRSYNTNADFELICADFDNGDVVLTGYDGAQATFTWLDRNGNVKLFQTFDGNSFEEILSLAPVSDNTVLITGYCAEDGDIPTGHVMVLRSDGVILRDFFIGDVGTKVQSGRVYSDGTIIVAGTTPRSLSKNNGFVAKVTKRDRLVYFYTAPTGAECVAFEKSISNSDLYAAFSNSASSYGDGSCVVRLDEEGSPYYITTIEDMSYVIEGVVPGTDGHLYLIGQGSQSGGSVIKLRPEGDVVFNKVVVPAGYDTHMAQLSLLPSGEIFVGGNVEGSTYFSILRADGTPLSTNVESGSILSVAKNPYGDKYAVNLFDYLEGRGKVIMFSKNGRRLYEKRTVAPYNTLRIYGNNDMLMASPSTGRLTMLSANGDLLFDRYVRDEMPSSYDQVYIAYTGEVYFVTGRNVMKLAHGVYVSDVTVTKPIEGSTTATFTVNLTGFSLDVNGTPRPVTVAYETVPGTAKEGLNYTPVSGVLSFVPTNDPTGNYVSKATVEVPVLANDLLEGERSFGLLLTNPASGYIIKKLSEATIVDQPAVVKMISNTPGTEGESNVQFELGIFKTNGVKLSNGTGADVVIEGTYGNGSADALDYDRTRVPRLRIAPGQHSGTFEVVTLEDTRYESVKTVIVDFNKVSAMSDTELSFGGSTLSCEGRIYDQPAMVTVESLGDFNRMNNVVSSLFKITLTRASDGAVQTNCSGADVCIKFDLDRSSSAVRGTDFVFTNDYDLRIYGDERSTATHINGIVLYSDASADKTVNVTLNSVSATETAGSISINKDKSTAGFTIKGE